MHEETDRAIKQVVGKRVRVSRDQRKLDAQADATVSVLRRLGHYLHVTEKKRDFQVFEITEALEDADESEWSETNTLEGVLSAWQNMQDDNRGILMCVKKDPGGRDQHDTCRCTHLTFQEYFAAEQCVQDARASGDVSGYYTQTFGNTPQWLREVALMYTEMLTPDEFQAVAFSVLDACDGSGAASVRVNQMLESRREPTITGVGAAIMERLRQTRPVELMVDALQHHCEELRDMVQTEVEKFQMSKAEIALGLVEAVTNEGQAWHRRCFGVRSLGKLRDVGEASETVLSCLLKLCLSQDSLPTLVEESLRALRNLDGQNS
jgi:hypothetical protein